MIIELNPTESNPSSVTANPAPESKPAATGLMVAVPKRQRPRHCKARAAVCGGVQGALVVTALAVAASAHGAVATWDSNSEACDSYTWNCSSNWSGGFVPGSSDTAVFDGNSPYTVDPVGSASVDTLLIDSATGYQFSNGSLDLGSGIQVIQGSQVIECDVGLQGSINDWSIASGADLTVNGEIYGSATLQKSGDGTLTLAGANSYTDGTVLGGGTLAVSSDSNLGDGSLAFGGNATLRILSTFSTGKTIGLASSTNIIEVDGGQTLTVNGVVSGSTGIFAKSGAGTLVLTASNTFSADVNLESGTLRISSGANLGNPAHTLYLLGPGTLQSTNSFTLDQAVSFAGGTVAVSAGNTLTFAGNVTGGGLIAKTGAGTLELAGGSSVGAGDAFSINAGTLRANSSLSTARIVVGANGVLAGGGSTAGNVIILPSGVISPGNSAGAFNVGGSLTNGGTYRCELDGESGDNLVVSSNLNLAGSTLDIAFLGGGATNKSYIIATYGTLSGTFATVSNLPPDFSLDYAYFHGGNSNNIALVFAPAASDACTNAPVVREGTYSGNTDSATNDGTSSCDTSINSRDVWFIYQASSNGVANARTGPDLGTDFDTVLTVFDGCGGAEIIANNDAYNDGFIGISEVSWVVTAGQMYWIRVAGYDGDTGNYALEIRLDPQPINDNCANALAVVDGSYVGTTVGTTTEGMLDCSFPETHDVWFVYTNPDECARDVTFSTCNGITDFDTILRAYDGCGGSSLGLNDDGCTGPNTGASTLTRTVGPGDSVWIRLYGFGNQTGQYQLDVSSVYNPLTLCGATLLHWALEEGSGTNTTESVSGESNVAHLVGDATWTNGVAPGSSHAVHISNAGTGWIDAGTLTTNGTYVAGMDAGYQSTGNQWTITAWVNLDNPQTSTGRRELIGSATGVANWWNLGVQDWAGTQEAITFDFQTVPVHATIGVPLGKPVFIAVIANSAGLGAVTNRHRFAIWDGTSWSYDEGTAFATLGLAVDIGTWREGVDKFDGVIDDVRIYDRTLTQTELAILAAQRPALAIAPVGAGSNSISWIPDAAGFVLQETTNLALATWTNSPSGHTNPIVVPANLPMKFYRLFKP